MIPVEVVDCLLDYIGPRCFRALVQTCTAYRDAFPDQVEEIMKPLRDDARAMLNAIDFAVDHVPVITSSVDIDSPDVLSQTLHGRVTGLTVTKSHCRRTRVLGAGRGEDRYLRELIVRYTFPRNGNFALQTG